MAQKPSILLLHGALGSAEQLSPFAQVLREHFEVHCFTFYGDGGKGNPDQPFRIEHFAEELAKELRQLRIGPLSVFGYSMVGYVALYLARQAPEFLHIFLHLAQNLAGRPKVNLQPNGSPGQAKKFWRGSPIPWSR